MAMPSCKNGTNAGKIKLKTKIQVIIPFIISETQAPKDWLEPG
jgi:hypothetical protein